MKKFGLLIITLCVSALSFGQNVAITDDDTYTANSSSMLDVKSTTKGFLSPRLTTVQRNAIVTPAIGLLVFDTSLNGFYYYNGTTWINLSSGSSSGLLWSYSSPNVYLTGASDKVGIGTYTPAHKLMVSDNVTLTDGTDGSFIDIQNQNNTTGVLSGIRFYNGTTVNTYKGGIFYKDVAGFGRGDLILANNSVNASGNVTSTDSRLTIKNTGGVEVKATTGAAANASLFHVLNATGDTIFAVYDGGVRVNVYDDPLVKATSSKGGFAVGGFSPSKGTSTNEYLRITPDSIRMYIEEGIPNKATTSKGGFAVGGFSPSKAIPSDYFNIYGSNTTTTLNPSDPRIFWYPLKEAFLAGRVLVQSPDSVGTNSFATGFESKAIGDYSQALGYSCIARSDYSTAIGKNALAKSLNSFAFGDNAKALNQDAYAFGAFTEAHGIGSFAFGYVGRDTLGPTGHVTKATGNYSFAFGLGSQSIGEGSLAFGAEDSAYGKYSIAMGYKSVADSWYGTAIGYKNRAFWSSTALGSNSKATGLSSTAIGYSSVASGENSISIGTNNTASNRYALAMGVVNNATADFSTAIGMQNTASGDNAVAIGYMNTASAGMATAFGAANTASGDASTVFGGFNTSSGDVSTAMGMYTTAQPMASVVLGRYNVISGTTNSWVDTEPLFIIGNGTGTTARSNALTVLKNAKTGIGIATPTHMLHVVDALATNDNAAIYGEHAITDNYGIGVEGYGKYKGVYGHTSQASGNGYGVQGYAAGAGTGTRYGVYGSASGGATAWAGYFNGSAYATSLNIGTTTQDSHKLTATSSSTGTGGSTGFFANTASSGLALIVQNSSTSSTDNALLVTQMGSSGDIASFDSWHGTGSWDREFRFTNTGDGRCDGGWYGGGADYAEYFPVSDTTIKYEPGDLISIDLYNNYSVTKSENSYSSNVIGVYSTNPVIVGNSSAESNPENSVLVGLLGVLPTKVSNENGEIKIGDYITSSSQKGVAMKATKTSAIIGRALENFNESEVGKIKVLINCNSTIEIQNISQESTSSTLLNKVVNENIELRNKLENVEDLLMNYNAEEINTLKSDIEYLKSVLELKAESK